MAALLLKKAIGGVLKELKEKTELVKS